MDYWEKYKEPEGEIRLDTIYLYGVDYMSTKAILEYFTYFSPSKVEWINDTSCNVVFPTHDNALQALNTNCLDSIQNFESFENYKRPALGYQVHDEMIPMYIRFATAGVRCKQDVKSEDINPKKSKYYKWRSQNIREKAIRKRKKHNDRYN